MLHVIQKLQRLKAKYSILWRGYKAWLRQKIIEVPNEMLLIADLIKKTDFDTELNNISNTVTSNKRQSRAEIKIDGCICSYTQLRLFMKIVF